MKILKTGALVALSLAMMGPVLALPVLAQNITESQADDMAKGNMWAELTKAVHVKKEKVGDTIVFKTSDKVALTNGTELPRGTKLVGKVTAVEGPSDGHGAQLTLQIAQAELRGGKTVPVNVLVTGAEMPQNMALASLSAGMQQQGMNAAQNAAGRMGSSGPQMANEQTMGTSGVAPVGSGTMTVVGGVMQMKNMPVTNLNGASFSSTTGDGGSVTFTGKGKGWSIDNGFKVRLEVMPAQ
uniref:Uncharacterized protein n=1 Tax=Acidobacterium capsulatum TaxID=33075 RepID=A0A7V5CT90_9BACT